MKILVRVKNIWELKSKQVEQTAIARKQVDLVILSSENYLGTCGNKNKWSMTTSNPMHYIFKYPFIELYWNHKSAHQKSFVKHIMLLNSDIACLIDVATGAQLGQADCASEVTGIQFNPQLKQVATSHHTLFHTIENNTVTQLT